MSMRAPVSVCMIVRDEAACLGACIESLRPHVEEIVIVDTGSTDETRRVACEAGADVVQMFTDCNNPETGLIEDFSLARNFSFSLATQPWRFWVDGDDVLVGGDKLAAVCERYERERGENAAIIAFPYEYDPHCHQYRERLVRLWDGMFTWVHPIHETITLLRPEATKAGLDDSLRVIHHKAKSRKPIEPGRNVRILRKLYAEMGESDARVLFYLGRELSFLPDHADEALAFLSRHVEISGWDEEKALACLRACETEQARGRHKEAIRWATRAITFAEKWGECYFAIGRSYYVLAEQKHAQQQRDRRNWERAVHFFQLGLQQPPTDTTLFNNPEDRTINVHRFLNIALNRMGDVEGALESAKTALEARPDDGNLLLNRAVYEIFLAERRAVEARKTIELHRATVEAAGLKAPQVVVAPLELSDLAKAIADGKVVGMVAAPNQAAAQAAVDRKPSSCPEIELAPGGLDIVIACPPFAYEDWNPATAKRHGIGGSETAVIEMSRRLAHMGHRVRVYATPGAGEGIYDGVEYRHASQLGALKGCDVYVAWRYCELLEMVPEARLKLLWVHDIFAHGAASARLLLADKVLALSDWHADFLSQHHHISRKQVHVTRNGIDLSRFGATNAWSAGIGVNRDPHKVVNSSSPDRSWLSLLQLWPMVRAKVPDATLHLFYGFDNWVKAAQGNAVEEAKISELLTLIAKLGDQGVVMRGRVDQATLAREFLSAGAWAYPTWFTETSCISAMEAQAAGLELVTTPIAALKETCPVDITRWVEGDWLSAIYQESFAYELIDALISTTDEDRQEFRERARKLFSWDGVAREWEALFRAELERKLTDPLVPYTPAPGFVRSAT